ASKIVSVDLRPVTGSCAYASWWVTRRARILDTDAVTAVVAVRCQLAASDRSYRLSASSLNVALGEMAHLYPTAKRAEAYERFSSGALRCSAVTPRLAPTLSACFSSWTSL